MKLLKKIFGSQESDQMICFIVKNYEEVYQHDEDVITKLEINLTEAGAIPAKIDFPSKLCCVTITDPAVKPENIQHVLEALGFQVEIIDTTTRKE
ncbi:MAG: hypothetical protein HS114_01280 [Anaerolineales bacterium]|nr:hypothetical protein [Anaerolineales bacterium]